MHLIRCREYPQPGMPRLAHPKQSHYYPQLGSAAIHEVPAADGFRAGSQVKEAHVLHSP